MDDFFTNELTMKNKKNKSEKTPKKKTYSTVRIDSIILFALKIAFKDKTFSQEIIDTIAREHLKKMDPSLLNLIDRGV